MTVTMETLSPTHPALALRQPTTHRHTHAHTHVAPHYPAIQLGGGTATGAGGACVGPDGGVRGDVQIEKGRLGVGAPSEAG